MSRIRNTDYNTVHHLTSRIAHQAFFLKENERNDLLSLILKVSAFSGVELLGWCLMNNHFHIFVYLPEPPVLSDEEVLARFLLLKEDTSRLFSDEEDDRIVNPYAESGAACQTPRANFERGISRENGAACQTPRAKTPRAMFDRVKSIRRRMYSIAEYMRMIKKWFSDKYNESSGHKGTMWEAVYGDKNPFRLPDHPDSYTDLLKRLAYIHLNPVRAAITPCFDAYPWSSYTAYRQGQVEAVEAMHRAYPGMPDEDIVKRHEELMGILLEEWKLRRAEEIARKRAAGYVLPTDPLTDECLVAQALAKIELVQKKVVELQLERKLAKGAKARKELICRQVVELISVYPDSTPQSLSKALEVPLRTIQRHLLEMIAVGRVCRDDGRLSIRPL